MASIWRTHTRKRIAVVVTGGACALGIAACGQSPDNSAQPPSQPPPPPPTSSAPATTTPEVSATLPTATEPAPSSARTGDHCTVGELRLSLAGGDAGAGSVFRNLVFTNAGDRTCTMTGFPGVSYVAGEHGRQVGKPATRTGDSGGTVSLAKGESAHAGVGFTNVRNYDPQVCQQQPVTGLRVYPPGETAAMFVPHEGIGCNGENIPGDQLTVKALVKG